MSFRPDTVWFVFRESIQRTTMNKFCRKGWSHLASFHRQGDEIIIYEPAPGFLGCELAAIGDEDVLAEVFEEHGWTVLKINNLDKKSISNKLKIALPTCVNIIKYIYGIDTWAQTPYQLYNYLRKNYG